MADPNVVDISTEWVWQKVATAVVSGIIHRITTTVYYYQTYRLTGEAAPSAPTQGTIPEEAVRLFTQSKSEEISSSDPIDVYIMVANQDDDANDTGKIRVDV